MFHALIPVIQAAVDGRRIVEDVREIHARDRWFTYPKFHETAGYAHRRLRQAGMEGVETIEFPADGKTLFGTWRGGFAWDARQATLEVLSPRSMKGRVLADYRQVPCSLAMWSAPTPRGGIEAEVIDVGAGTSAADYAGQNVRGKIVFANARAGAVKALAAEHGAVGILTDWNPQQEKNRDSVFWNNAFADAQGGWPLTVNCSRMFAFGVTRNVGEELRAMLGRGERLRVRAKVDTRIYEGTFPVVTGVIAGKTGEEILALGHAFEQGAKDNASGVACIMEATRVLARLIKAGKLPRPRRGIRTLVTNECFGTIGYVDRFPERTKKTVAAICLDEVGTDRLYGGEIQSIYLNPQSNANYVDSLVEVLAEAVWKRPVFNPWMLKAYGGSDNLIAHPSIGVPAVWVGCHGSRMTWHTTLDTPERMSPEQLGAASVYTAVYLYFLANAGEREAVWLAEVAVAAGVRQMNQEKIAARASVLEKPSRRARIEKALAARLSYLEMVHGNAVQSVLGLAETKAVKGAVRAGVKALKAAAGGGKHVGGSAFGTKMSREAGRVRVRAKYSGPITYDQIPADQREGHVDPRWGLPVNVALGWVDGKRTVAEIVALAEQELGMALPGVAEELIWLAGVEDGPVGAARG